MFDLKHWEGSILVEHLALYAAAKLEGYAVLTFSQYGHANAPLYAVVIIKRANNREQRAFWAKRRSNFRDIVDAQAKDSWAKDSWGPVLISAHGPADGALFAGVFEKSDPIGVTKLTGCLHARLMGHALR